MAKWMEFSADYDHQWPSRAVTAFKAGMKVYVKDSVAVAAEGEGKAKPCRKPAKGEDAYRATADPFEGGSHANAGDPEPDSAEAESVRIQAGGSPPAGNEGGPDGQGGGEPQDAE